MAYPCGRCTDWTAASPPPLPRAALWHGRPADLLLAEELGWNDAVLPSLLGRIVAALQLGMFVWDPAAQRFHARELDERALDLHISGPSHAGDLLEGARDVLNLEPDLADPAAGDLHDQVDRLLERNRHKLDDITRRLQATQRDDQPGMPEPPT